MNRVISQKEQFWEELTRSTGALVDSVPTFDNRIDTFFGDNLDNIKEEWGLITGSDLEYVARKIDYLSYEVNRLVAERSNTEQRVQNLKSAVAELEAKK